MERKTPEQIQESHSFNHPGRDSEFTKETCKVMMQRYADQEMLLFANWRDKYYFKPFSGIGNAEKWKLRDNYQTEDYTHTMLTDAQLLTLYKEQQYGK